MYMELLTATREVDTNIDNGKDEVEECFKLFLSPPALGGHPVQCIQCVLANGSQ